MGIFPNIILVSQWIILLSEAALRFELIEKTLCNTLVLSLKTAQNNNTYNHPENTRVTILKKLSKIWIFFLGGLKYPRKCQYLWLLFLLQEISLPFFPVNFIFYECINQFRIIAKLWVYLLDINRIVLQDISNSVERFSDFLSNCP